MLQNPIFKGFNPDPAICRKGDDYYVAVSTFEWFPGIPIYHSKDMKHWELLTHVLTDDTNPNLTKLPSAKGIWAPCLTYCEEEDMFYVIYGVMNSMNARYFDVNNYLMCAEGGTGYNHSVTMGRSRNVWGPYEPDPNGPLVTSQPKESNERADDDHLKPRYFNPDSVLQKSGHGSYVDLPNGETYLVHLTSRPFVPELRCTLGRETAIQKMQWTSDGWLRMADGSNLAKIEVEEPNLPDVPMPEIPNFDDFDGGELGNWYYSPRQMPSTFANATERPGWLRVRGEESLASLNRTSLLTRKLTSVYATVTTKMEFEPEVYQHSAGLTIYYDNMNNIFLRKYYSQTLGGSAISIVRLENGEKTEMLDTRVAVEDKPIYFRLNIEGRRTWFEWGYDGENWTKIGPDFDTTTFSDEYCKFGEFTGTMVGIAVTDASLHERTADFDFFDYEADETKPVD